MGALRKAACALSCKSSFKPRLLEQAQCIKYDEAALSLDLHRANMRYLWLYVYIYIYMYG